MTARFVTAAVLFLSLVSFSKVLAQDVTIYDKNWNRTGTVRDGKIYDKDWNVQGYVKDNRVYDRDWNQKATIVESGTQKK